MAKAARSDMGDAISALSTSDPNGRAAACLRLGMYPEAAEESVPHLVRLLADQTPVPMDMNSEWGRGVDSYAMEALSVLGKGRVRLLAPYADIEDSNVRARLAIIFGAIGDPEAIEQLLVMLDDPNLAARGNAVSILGELQVRKAIPRFREILERESATGEQTVKYATVLSLAKMGKDGLDVIRTSRPHLSGDVLELADRLLTTAE